MSHRIKPNIGNEAAQAILEKHWGGNVTELVLLSGGNMSEVYSFVCEGKEYVIHFSSLHDAFETVSFISELLTAQGVPYLRVCGKGSEDGVRYMISEKIEGKVIADIAEDRKSGLLTDLVDLVVKLNQVDIGATKGFGWITDRGEGAYRTWDDFIVSFFQEDQSGTFWEGWYDLFRSSFLEKDVFEECYARLIHYAPYNSPHRYFVHGDCHAWNILTDGRKITGIIDGNCLYGDFLIDVSIAEDVIPGSGFVEAVRERYENLGIEVPDFRERMLGARYFKGLDGLRFYAKTERKASYDHLRTYLLSLTN